ncbi:MAG: DUF3368 domain-containing protein [Candidatus Rokubacteria bacterium]|nr:DUF3368 domain-containing protein [Candidatus Rokubacteria bacterium]
MPETLVIDIGPIVALARAGALDLVARLPIEFVCPPEVKAELDEGQRAGYPAAASAWLKVVPLVTPVDPLATAAVDPGEAAVIQLAREQGIAVVCIDERKGRRAALAVGLQVTGSLGLLIRSKHLGLTPAVRPFIERAMESGIWYDTGLIRRVLALEGE